MIIDKKGLVAANSVREELRALKQQQDHDGVEPLEDFQRARETAAITQPGRFSIDMPRWYPITVLFSKRSRPVSTVPGVPLAAP